MNIKDLIDISTEQEKQELLEIFQSLDSIVAVCNYYNIQDQPNNRYYIKYVAEEIGFDLNDFKEKRHPKKYCKQCGKLLTGQQTKFCSSSCAASYNNKLRGPMKEETKQKIRESSKIHFDKNKKVQIYTCKVCGKKFNPRLTKSGRYSKSLFCSDECLHNFRVEQGKEAYKSAVKHGTFKSWQSRNITSYPENFWITVLNNNNIKFTRELFFKKKYFLDFYIEKNNKRIDLEIDGKQHLREDHIIHDKERDEFITSHNIIVYRIPWNQINNKEGKEKMKNKIDKFIDFYNSL